MSTRTVDQADQAKKMTRPAAGGSCLVMKRARPSALHLVLLASAGLAMGCDSEEDAPPPPPAKAPAAAAAAPAAAPAGALPGEAPTVYTYNAVGKRDPYRSYFAEVDEEAAQAAGTQSELQRFDIDQLKLVGVVVGTATPIAMVEDPTGLGHVVREGTLMGKHWGQVKHIRRGEIIIQEEFRDFTGRRVSHLVPLKIPEEELAAK
jgi:type IV pilus assembly protein PilP